MQDMAAQKGLKQPMGLGGGSVIITHSGGAPTRLIEIMGAMGEDMRLDGRARCLEPAHGRQRDRAANR